MFTLKAARFSLLGSCRLAKGVAAHTSSGSCTRCFSSFSSRQLASQLGHRNKLWSFTTKVKQENSWGQAIKHFCKIAKQLSKARLSTLVVVTTAVGYITGSEAAIDWVRLGWTSVGTFGAAACANTLNQIYEVKNDGQMTRTRMRPLPLGKITKIQALAFATLMGVGGTLMLYEKANALTAGLGVANIILYAGVYTPMKVFSVANTWMGAVVGAIPPLMGWTAAAGDLEPGAFVLGAALYFWQLPHFFSLAWLCKDDYIRGGYSMLPKFDATGKRTAACALRNSLYMLPFGAIAVWIGIASLPFAYEATTAAGTLATTAAIFYQSPSQRSARLLFRFSILFLPVFMLGLVLHRIPNTHSTTLQDLRKKIIQDLETLTVPRRYSPHDPVLCGDLQKISAAPFPFLPVPVRNYDKLTAEEV